MSRETWRLATRDTSRRSDDDGYRLFRLRLISVMRKHEGPHPGGPGRRASERASCLTIGDSQMPGAVDYLGWAAAVVALSLILVTISVVLIALAALAARAPATRRHCLSVLQHLTQYIDVLRRKR